MSVLPKKWDICLGFDVALPNLSASVLLNLRSRQPAGQVDLTTRWRWQRVGHIGIGIGVGFSLWHRDWVGVPIFAGGRHLGAAIKPDAEPEHSVAADPVSEAASPGSAAALPKSSPERFKQFCDSISSSIFCDSDWYVSSFTSSSCSPRGSSLAQLSTWSMFKHQWARRRTHLTWKWSCM